MTDDDRLLDRRSGAAFQAWKWRWGLAVAALQSAVYFGIGQLHLARSTELLRTPLDDAIPLLPWTAWCYLPFYVGVFIICIIGFRSHLLFKRALTAVVVVMGLGALGHLFVGAEYPRPRLHAVPTSVSEAFLAWVYSIDRPGNVFPSLHVAHTSSLAFVLLRDRPRLGRVTVVMAAMLALSTLTTKQHFIADVIAGYAIAFTVRMAVLFGIPPSTKSTPPL